MANANRLLFLAAQGVLALEDGQALSPPMGWRNWNNFQANISQEIMEAQMAALTMRTRSVIGRDGLTSLADVGYARAGLDDAWQACGTGVGGGFHDSDGNPLVNKTTFPDMKGMVDYGHSLGLKMGWYINNCICGGARLTSDQVDADTAGNVRALTSWGFDSVKADGCGPGKNMTWLSQMLNETGREVLIENCHYNKVVNRDDDQPHDSKGRIWPYWRDNVTGGELVCPEHFFRASGDIRNSWGSLMGNVGSLTAYQDLEHPISRPGCWAYADMMMVGVMASDYAPKVGPALSTIEWRSHFGAWCVVSSPLILSFDLANETTLDAVWPFITNLEAIGVNQQWAGHPGRVVSAGSAVVWAKPQPGGAQAVLVLNQGGHPVNLTLSMRNLTLPDAVNVRDIWEHSPLTDVTTGNFEVMNLEPHDSRFLLFTPLGPEYV